MSGPVSDPDAIVYRCGCGRAYNLGQWRALPSIGVQRMLVGDREVPDLVCRNCPCTSTLCVAVEVEGDTLVTAASHANPTAGCGDNGPRAFRRVTEIVCWRVDAPLYAAALNVVGYEYVEVTPLPARL